jgi:choloylglycine hydrolase
MLRPGHHQRQVHETFHTATTRQARTTGIPATRRAWCRTGDLTPPSRFVRAAAFTATCRPLARSSEAVFESFRILDNLKITQGAQVPRQVLPNDIVSATQVTSAADLKEKVYYYHTMWNRQVRMIGLKRIDFATVREQVIDDDADKRNATKDVTPVPARKWK